MANYQNFEGKDKRNANVKNVFERHGSFNKQSDLLTKQEKLMEGVALWASYYRSNPHRFCEDYLGVKLKLFQKILLNQMMDNNYTMYCAARGCNNNIF